MVGPGPARIQFVFLNFELNEVQMIGLESEVWRSRSIFGTS